MILLTSARPPGTPQGPVTALQERATPSRGPQHPECSPGRSFRCRSPPVPFPLCPPQPPPGDLGTGRLWLSSRGRTSASLQQPPSPHPGAHSPGTPRLLLQDTSEKVLYRPRKVFRFRDKGCDRLGAAPKCKIRWEKLPTDGPPRPPRPSSSLPIPQTGRPLCEEAASTGGRTEPEKGPGQGSALVLTTK